GGGRRYRGAACSGVIRGMAGRPVPIRRVDPPLHEFLPNDEASQRQMAERMGVDPSEVATRVSQLHELNPMLGHRGCRLAVTYPEILRMQVRAIVEAAIEDRKSTRLNSSHVKNSYAVFCLKKKRI